MTFRLDGQPTVQKFVLIEHFSNTWCPICAGRNPDFYATIQKYSKNVHQISIHPPYPYSGCPLYQYNKAENQEKANMYNIQGTPAVVLNGGSTLGGSPLLTEDALKKEIAKTSPLSVLVSESGAGSSRSALVTLKPNGNISGDLRLVAIIVERNVKFTASNGELDHFNVMRKYLTPVSGQKISITDATEKKYVFNFKDSVGWKPEEAYVLAYVQNASTNEVLNSGTKFDNLTTSVNTASTVLPLKVYPTLANDYINIDLPMSGNKAWEIIDAHGQTIQKGHFNESKAAILSILPLTQGLYWIKLETGNTNSYIAKFIKS
jgi:thiol-disulfide isomerase/thioredoxin